MKVFKSILQPTLSALLGLLIGLAFTWALGANPLHVFGVLIHGSMGSAYDLGMTLFYTTPLIFTGLSVAFAYQSGLFNIGAEGQLTIGAFSVAALGLLFPDLPAPFSVLLAVFGAFAAGAFWGGIAGSLRAYRGSHEVITTIMLNFIASALTSYFTLYVFKSLDSQSPETRPIPAAYSFARFEIFDGAPVSAAFIIAVLMCFAVWFFLKKTVLGYEIRAVGQNELAAQLAGIEVKKMRVLSMLIAGGLAGLVALAEVMGNALRYKMGFSPGFGFLGIAVALLARGHPIGILFSALLFGMLHKGTAELEFETEVISREVSFVFQALVVLVVSAEGLWEYLRSKTPILRRGNVS